MAQDHRIVAAHDGPVRSRSRSAFTLIELLVVVGVMAVVMGMAVGAFASLSRDSRLQAAERLLTDLIRQARHTARSSGLPVILRVEEVLDETGRVTGGTISGITQTTLVSEAFEDDAKWHDPADVLDKTTVPKFTIGRTGHGLRQKTQKDPPTDLRWPSLDRLRNDFASDDRSKRLVDTRLRNQGFHLGVAIHMPNILATGTHHRPLVIVGSHDSAAIDTSVAGLILRTQWRPMQRTLGVDEARTPKDVLVNTYEVIGWVGDGKGRRSTISSVDDVIQQGAELHATASYDDFMAAHANYQLRPVDPFADVNPVLGPKARNPQYVLRTNRWVDVGLMYDGRYLTLFLDGVAVNRREATVSLPDEAGFNTLWYGAMRLPSSLRTDYSHEAIPQDYYLQDGILDDVRLARLGGGQPISLPRGVRPWFATAGQRFELVIHPDGRCQQRLFTIDGGTTPVAGPLQIAETGDTAFLTDTRGNPSRSLTIQVDVAGHVHAQQPTMAIPYTVPAATVQP